MGDIKLLSQIQTNHTIITFLFIKTRCFIGYTTIKKRSTEIDAMVRTDTINVADETNRKILVLLCGTVYATGANEQVKRSEIAKFSTRYVAEFLKHFNGSFIYKCYYKKHM